MKLNYKKNFFKAFAKQPKKIQLKATKSLKLFQADEKNKSLRRHKLKGKKFKNYESIDVTGDVRIILDAQKMEIIDIWDIGTHSQLYG